MYAYLVTQQSVHMLCELSKIKKYSEGGNSRPVSLLLHSISIQVTELNLHSYLNTYLPWHPRIFRPSYGPGPAQVIKNS